MHACGDAGVEGKRFVQRGLHIGMAAEVDALGVGHKQAAALFMHFIRAVGQGLRIDVIKRHSTLLFIFIKESLAYSGRGNLPFEIDDLAGAGFAGREKLKE